MFGLGPTELIVIFMIILVLFGAKKLPQIGDGLGAAIHNFKRAIRIEPHGDPEKVPATIAEPKKDQG